VKDMRCTYCIKGELEEVEYNKTVMFLDVPIEYHAHALHCTNPDCPEPYRFSAQQLEELSSQRDEYLRSIGRADIIPKKHHQKK
jgi:shikimate kinase